MKEIGGYFGLECFGDVEYYKNLLRLNTGRNCIVLNAKVKKYSKLFIPRYICSCIPVALSKNDIVYEYYDITEKFLPDLKHELEADEDILIVNYYCQLDNKTIKALMHKYKKVILDNTQSFFQKPCEDLDTVYSCRKFFGYLGISKPPAQRSVLGFLLCSELPGACV